MSRVSLEEVLSIMLLQVVARGTLRRFHPKLIYLLHHLSPMSLQNILATATVEDIQLLNVYHMLHQQFTCITLLLTTVGKVVQTKAMVLSQVVATTAT